MSAEFVTRELYRRLNIPIFDDISMQKHILECVIALLNVQVARQYKPVYDVETARWSVFWKYLSQISLGISTLGEGTEPTKPLKKSIEFVSALNSSPNAIASFYLNCALSCSMTLDREMMFIEQSTGGKSSDKRASNGKKCLMMKKSSLEPVHEQAVEENRDRMQENSNLTDTIIIPPSKEGSVKKSTKSHKKQIIRDGRLLKSCATGALPMGNSIDAAIHFVCRNTTDEGPHTLKRLLINNPNNARLRGNYKKLPLHIIVEYSKLSSAQRLEMFLLLITVYSEGMAVADENGNTPLLILCWQDYPEAFAMIDKTLKLCPRASRVPGNYGLLPIHYARGIKTVKILEATYPESLSVNVPEYGTPLHQAACWQSVEVVVYLYVCRPQSIQEVTTWGHTPLHKSAISRVSSCAVLHAVFNFYPDAIRAVDYNGNTPLHNAVDRLYSVSPVSEYADKFRFLLKTFPEATSIVNNDDDTPYSYCANDGASEYFLRLLLRAGSDDGMEDLKRLNYASRRVALFLFFKAVRIDNKLTIFSQINQTSNGKSLVKRVIEYL